MISRCHRIRTPTSGIGGLLDLLFEFHLPKRRHDSDLGGDVGLDVETHVADDLLDGRRVSRSGHRHAQHAVLAVEDHRLQPQPDVQRNHPTQGVRGPPQHRGHHRRHAELFGKRLQQGVLVDEAEPEQLRAETPAAVVARLETGVELGDGDGATIEKDLTQTLHRPILYPGTDSGAAPQNDRQGVARRPTGRHQSFPHDWGTVRPGMSPIR